MSASAIFTVTAWAFPLIGNTGHTPPASLSLDFEWSDDAETWSTFIGSTPITTPSSQTIVQQDLVHRWLRVKLTLVEDQDEVVAVTCWVIGNLERRET